MNDYDQTIRASSLGNLANCWRLWAASKYRKLCTQAHPDVSFSPFDYKPSMGTTFHALEERGIPLEELAEVSHEVLEHEASKMSDEEFFTSDKFPDIDSMVIAVVAMNRSFRETSHSRPWHEDRENSTFETPVEVDELFGEKLPIRVTGTIDLVHDTDEGKEIIDLKTTAVIDPKTLHQVQVTAYRGMAEESGADMLTHAKIIKIERPRTPKFRIAPRVKAYSLDTTPHEKRVVRLVKHAADILDKKAEWVKDFSVIPCNPYCGACGYCDLRATTACPETAFMSVPDENAPDRIS